MKSDDLRSIPLHHRQPGPSAGSKEEWTLSFDEKRNRLRIIHRSFQDGDANRGSFESVRDLEITDFLNEDPEHPAAVRLRELLNSMFK